MIASVMCFGGAALAGFLPTRPVVVQTSSGPVYQCVPPETLHIILGQPFCW